jgi:peptide deformylase
MIIKNATQVGNLVIRAQAKKVKNIHTKEVQKVIKDLIDSMRHHGLVGMAAPQIGKSLKIFVTEIRKTKTRNPKDTDVLRVFINPSIISYSKKEVFIYEGCGSVAHADLFAKISRPESIVIKAHDEKGEPFELKAKGLLARVIQHEQDHIDGKIFLDKLTDTKSLMSGDEYREKFKR